MMKFLKNDELQRPAKDEYQGIEKIPVIIVLDNVRSGMNVGSIFRSSDSFLIDQILLCGITASPPDREVLKTALGATESVSWKHFDSTKEALSELKSNGYKLLAVEQCERSILLNDFIPEKSTKYALVFGNEVKGVDEKLIPFLDGCIEIPQSGTKHSLNISVCAGIVIWHFYNSYKK